MGEGYLLILNVVTFCITYARRVQFVSSIYCRVLFIPEKQPPNLKLSYLHQKIPDKIYICPTVFSFPY